MHWILLAGQYMADFLGQDKNGISILTLNKKVNEKIEIY